MTLTNKAAKQYVGLLPEGAKLEVVEVNNAGIVKLKSVEGGVEAYMDSKSVRAAK